MTQVVVITGGSRGIGRATAIRYARRGARLVLIARDRTALDSAAADCRRSGAQVLPLSLDLALPGSSQRAVDAAILRFGRIDVWVSAASVFSYGSVEDTPAAVRERVIETNLLGPMRDAQAVLPRFRRQGSGTIVFVGSLYSQVAGADVAPYVAAKHGLLGFARALRQEMLGHSGIRVRVVLPASIDTAIYQRAANVTGRTPHPLPPVVSATRVARAIEHAANGRRPEISVGAAQFAARPLRVLAPGLYDRGMRILQRTLGLRRRPAPDSTGAVLIPLHDPGAISGGWRRIPRGRR